MASPKKSGKTQKGKTLDVVCSPELVRELEYFRDRQMYFGDRRRMSMSEALRTLAKKGLDFYLSEEGDVLSAEAVALAEDYDKLDSHGKTLVKMTMDLEQRRVQDQKPSASLAARSNQAGPIREKDMKLFLNEQVKQSDEEL